MKRIQRTSWSTLRVFLLSIVSSKHIAIVSAFTVHKMTVRSLCCRLCANSEKYLSIVCTNGVIVFNAKKGDMRACILDPRSLIEGSSTLYIYPLQYLHVPVSKWFRISHDQKSTTNPGCLYLYSSSIDWSYILKLYQCHASCPAIYCQTFLLGPVTCHPILQTQSMNLWTRWRKWQDI